MSLQCPSNKELIDDLCYSRCPPGYEVQTIDVLACVATVPCPYSITVQDPADNALCNKVSFSLTNGTCSDGYTQWLNGECFANCPLGFMDNGLSCSKRSLDRLTSYPTCSSSWYVYENGACVYGTGSTILIFVICLTSTLVILFILFMIMQAVQQQRASETIQYLRS
jgi:hypothetical protein